MRLDAPSRYIASSVSVEACRSTTLSISSKKWRCNDFSTPRLAHIEIDRQAWGPTFPTFSTACGARTQHSLAQLHISKLTCCGNLKLLYNKQPNNAFVILTSSSYCVHFGLNTTDFRQCLTSSFSPCLVALFRFTMTAKHTLQQPCYMGVYALWRASGLLTWPRGPVRLILCEHNCCVLGHRAPPGLPQRVHACTGRHGAACGQPARHGPRLPSAHL